MYWYVCTDNNNTASECTSTYVLIIKVSRSECTSMYVLIITVPCTVIKSACTNTNSAMYYYLYSTFHRCTSTVLVRVLL